MSHEIADVLHKLDHVDHKLDHLIERSDRRHRAEVRRDEAQSKLIAELAQPAGSDAEQVAKLKAILAKLSAIAPTESETP